MPCRTLFATAEDLVLNSKQVVFASYSAAASAYVIQETDINQEDLIANSQGDFAYKILFLKDGSLLHGVGTGRSSVEEGSGSNAK